jgi:hypothetical protein
LSSLRENSQPFPLTSVLRGLCAAVVHTRYGAEWSHAIIGASIDVHRTLGPGFPVYEAALAVELELRGVPFSHQHSVALNYQGHTVGEEELDFLVAALSWSSSKRSTRCCRSIRHR